MIDRIFIPTVNRVNDQITLSNIPKSLMDKVTLVVQGWERKKYKYNVDYLVLPKNINLDDYLCLSKSRKIIYEEGRDLKYCVLDDDLIFKRRNQKRFGLPSDMDKSSRVCTENDTEEMFNLFDGWLDEEDVSFCGSSQIQNIPQTKLYSSNSSISSCVWFNGKNFNHILDDLPMTKVKYGEDVLFFLSLLSRGFGNRVSQLFCFGNESLKGKITSDVWDNSTFKDVWRDHKIIENMYPKFFKVLLDENGRRIKGGFRDYGKVRTSWSKCYKSSQTELVNDMNVPKPVVKESNVYVNLVDTLPDITETERKKLSPNLKKSPYPFTLKVHCWTLGNTEKFVELMKRKLTSDDKTFTYIDKSTTKPENWKYVEKRKNPFKKGTSHKERYETQIWKNTLEFTNDPWIPYFTFNVIFKTEDSYVKFSKRVKQRLSLERNYMTFPSRVPRVWKYKWMSKWKNPNPKYPIYIISKGRGDSRLTSKCLERLNVPYYIVIEPQDYDEYSCMIDESKILVLPFSNHGDGPGRGRNWCWDHSKSMGFKRHWVMDDNITDFHRLHRNKKYPIGDGGMFRVLEEFVDRFENVPLSGLQYDFFTVDKKGHPPFVLNTRIYSILLIENDGVHRWRGRYNEDTILSLDILKDGDCTIQFNNLLQGKVGTQLLGGGNSDEFYFKEGTYNKSKMLEVEHPDVCKVVWKFGRIHHEVNYLPFKDNELRYVKGYDPKNNIDETELFEMVRVKSN